MLNMTVQNYLIEMVVKETGQMPLGLDAGYWNRVCDKAQFECDPVDVTEDGDPIYSEDDLEWCVEALEGGS